MIEKRTCGLHIVLLLCSERNAPPHCSSLCERGTNFCAVNLRPQHSPVENDHLAADGRQGALLGAPLRQPDTFSLNCVGRSSLTCAAVLKGQRFKATESTDRRRLSFDDHHHHHHHRHHHYPHHLRDDRYREQEWGYQIPLFIIRSLGHWNTPLMSAQSMETTSVTNGAGPVHGVKDDDLSPEDLSEMLAAGTKEVHEKAENTQFVKDFLRGRIRKELFKLGALALYYTYTAMEEEIERNKDHPHFAPLYFPAELHRHQALARDLEYFYGPEWQSQLSCSKATQRYVDRIHQVGREDPVLLVAHAYTRYMGDLSGGQVLKKVAQRALKLPPTGEGLEFYQFDAIHSAKAFKQLYRSRMNELELDVETKKRLVGEAVKAFQFNMEVFDELEEIGKTIQEDVLDAGMPVHGAMGGDISKCPYYTAKMGASVGTTYACQLFMAVLRHPTGQVLFATWFAALAGLAAWYLM